MASSLIAATLTEEIELGRDGDVRSLPTTAHIETTHNRDGQAAELAGCELRCARDLVGDRDVRGLELVADRIMLTGELEHHLDAGGADRNVSRPVPPRPSERLGDHHTDVPPRALCR